MGSTARIPFVRSARIASSVLLSLFQLVELGFPVDELVEGDVEARLLAVSLGYQSVDGGHYLFGVHALLLLASVTRDVLLEDGPENFYSPVLFVNLLNQGVDFFAQ